MMQSELGDKKVPLVTGTFVISNGIQLEAASLSAHGSLMVWVSVQPSLGLRLSV